MATLLRSAVLNPEGFRTVRAAGEDAGSKRSFSSLAPRLDSLNGKTVYLVDTGFGGSGKFLDQMQVWFANQMPSEKWRAKPLSDGCTDGTCGLPDEP